MNEPSRPLALIIEDEYQLADIFNYLNFARNSGEMGLDKKR